MAQISELRKELDRYVWAQAVAAPDSRFMIAPAGSGLKEVLYMSKARPVMTILLVALAVSAVASAPASAHQWLKNGSPLTQTEPVLTEGGLIIIFSAAAVIHCEKQHDFELVFGDLDLRHEWHFLECVTTKPNCDVSSPGAPRLIFWLNLHSLILTVQNSKKEEVLADEIRGGGTKELFGDLLFTSLVANACSPLPELVALKGKVNAAIKNATEELVFPEPELQGNTLELNGVAAKMVGSEKFMLTNGGSLSAE